MFYWHYTWTIFCRGQGDKTICNRIIQRSDRQKRGCGVLKKHLREACNIREGRKPCQPHPGTRIHCYRCSLPGLTGFTVYRCGRTDTATITTFDISVKDCSLSFILLWSASIEIFAAGILQLFRYSGRQIKVKTGGFPPADSVQGNVTVHFIPPKRSLPPPCRSPPKNSSSSLTIAMPMP